MPSGKVHAAATIVLTAAVSGALYHFGFPLTETISAGAGCLTGLILTPDLDVNSGSASHSNMNRLGGWAIGLAWNVLWKPYALLIRHRSFLSHAPVIGTAIRLLYVLGVPWLMWYLVANFFPQIPTPFQVTEIPPLFWWLAGGLSISDAAHFVFDQVF